MSSLLRNWTRSDQPMLLPFIAILSKSRQFTKSHLSKIKDLTCGVLFGSSASLPFLYSLNLDVLVILDLIIFFFSAIFFMILNTAEIAENGNYAVAGSILLFTMGILSHRISLKDFGPYMPISISTILVCTTYIIPWIRRCTQEMYAITIGDHFMVTRGSYQASMDPTSSRSVGTSHDNPNWTLGLPVHPLDFAHMDYLGRQHQIRRPDLLENGSGIDLESSLHEPILNTSRNAIVDRVMEEFWVIFNREWDSGFRGCAGTPSASSGISGSTGDTDSTRNTRSSLRPQKRKRDDGKTPDEDQDRTPHQPKGRAGLCSGPHTNKKFTCPFRKHNPQVFSIHDYRVCALSHWETIARVKEHLYRCHQIPLYCKRCWTHFRTQEKLDFHLTVAAADICELKPGIAPEGITAEQEKCLRSRKKSFPDQSDKDRWKHMYKLLFSNEDIPSPYDRLMSLESSDIANYEDYVRRELPRLVRVNIEETVRRETQPLDEPLIRALVSIIQDCHDKVFRSYCESRGFGRHVSVLTSLENDGNVDLARCEQETGKASQFLEAVFESPPAYSAETTRTLIRTGEMRNTLFDLSDDLIFSASGSRRSEHLYSCNCPGPCDLSCLNSQLQEGDSGEVFMTDKWGMESSDIQWPDWRSFPSEKP